MANKAFVCTVVIVSIIIGICDSYNKDEKSAKIVGGIQVDVESFPYVASIQVPGMFGRRHICGGAILNNEWILTAAHCLHFFNDARAYQVRLGANLHDEPYQATDISVIEKHSHPDYVHGNNVSILHYC